MPEVISLLVNRKAPSHCEHDILVLPSHLPPSFLENTVPSWYQELKDIELELRKGQANDALQNIRNALVVKDALYVGRRKHSNSNKSNTRAQAWINGWEMRSKLHAALYRNARSSMLSLGFSQTDPTYQILSDSDIRMKSVSGPKNKGDGRITDSWIWSAGKHIARAPETNEDDWDEDSEYLVVSNLFTL